MKWTRLAALILSFAVVGAAAFGANDYYTHGGFPATGASLSSSSMRAELDLIMAGFDKFPTLAGAANKAVVINGGATGLTTTTGTMALTGNFSIAGNFSTTGAFNTSFTQGASTTLILPVVNGTLATLAGTETFTTKTLNLASNTLTGTTAQFNTALSDNDFATLAGAEALTNKTITSPSIGGTVAGGATYTSIVLNTPTINTPTFSGTASGSLSGLAVTNGVMTTSTVAADPSAALGIASKQYVDNTNNVGSPILNGNMEVWQRGTTFATVANGTYTADRWQWLTSGAGVVTINRSTNVPTFAQAGVLFNYSLEVDVTTVDASLSAGDIYVVRHKIEGYNWRHFAQRALVVSFWVSSSKTGIHSLALLNSAFDRSYVGEYTVSVADTWEYKTVTVVASPSAGTWDYTTGVGLLVEFDLAGSAAIETGTIGSWVSATAHGSTNQVNVMDNTANFFRVTGVKMELGSTATAIQWVPFQEELARCQRYYEKSFDYATAPAQNAGSNTGETIFTPSVAGAVSNTSPPVSYMVTKLGTPTVTFFNPNAANAQVRNRTDSADLSATTTISNAQHGFGITATGTAGTAVGEVLAVHWTSESEL